MIYRKGVTKAAQLLNQRNLLNSSMLYVMCCPVHADFFGVLIKAVYHQSNYDSAAAAYRIGLFITM
jgi:hypothetical protein